MGNPEAGIASEPLSARAARARYQRILRFAALHLASLWWFELVLPRFGLNSIANKTRAKRLQRIARSFQKLALDLSGLLIKLGQFMSTRLDILPAEITKELEGLQDEVPAETFAVIRAEHPDLLRLSCIHEEIAQGLGLANDSPTARPSIFNDDEEFALLTRQDELMLKMLYNPALRPGMTEAEARPIVESLAASLVGGDS